MTTDDFWWITLGLGLVAAAAAVALLQAFLNRIQRVERGAASVWASAQQVARNTATTWMLGQTAERLDRLGEEALRHDDLLRASSGGPSSGRPSSGGPSSGGH